MNKTLIAFIIVVCISNPLFANTLRLECMVNGEEKNIKNSKEIIKKIADKKIDVTIENEKNKIISIGGMNDDYEYLSVSSSRKTVDESNNDQFLLREEGHDSGFFSRREVRIDRIFGKIYYTSYFSSINTQNTKQNDLERNSHYSGKCESIKNETKF